MRDYSVAYKHNIFPLLNVTKYIAILERQEESITHPSQQEIDLLSALNMDALEIQFASHQQNLIHQ